MKKDMITIFNQLTSSELADYELFNELIDNHYEKVKYLYSIINDLDLRKIDKIYCKTTQHKLKIFIEPYEIQYTNEIIYTINSKRNDYVYSKYFNLDLIEEKDILRIDIGVTNDKEEVDFYENRFI